MEFNVRDKVAVVTGSSAGIGFAYLESFVLGHAKRVYMHALTEPECAAGKAALEKFVLDNGRATQVVAVAADLSSVAGQKVLLEAVKQHDTRVDIFVANAGVVGTQFGKGFEDHPEEGFKQAMNVNVGGMFFGVQQFAPLMARPKSESPARVLVTSSFAGLSNSKSGSGYGYTASKAAVLHLSKKLAIQLPEMYNINVHVICPSFVINTPMSKNWIKYVEEKHNSECPRGRFPQLDDLRPLVLFLCDDKTNYLNGLVVPLDGGYNLVGPSF